jgi:CubicO group peptidase (beta-lactamase class C family)
MNSTGFFYSDVDPEKIAVPHELFPFNQSSKELEITKILRAPGSACILSNVLDISHFMIAHMNEGVYQDSQILSDSSISLMHQDSLGNDGYGLGWATSHMDRENIPGLVGHIGATMGYRVHFFFNKNKEIGVNLFMNQWHPSSFTGNALYQFILNTAYLLEESGTVSTFRPFFSFLSSLCVIIVISRCRKRRKI